MKSNKTIFTGFLINSALFVALGTATSLALAQEMQTTGAGVPKKVSVSQDMLTKAGG